MVKYPAWGVNGRPTNIEDIVIDEIAAWFHDDVQEFLYEKIIENNDIKLADIVYADINSYEDGLYAYGYDSWDDVDYYGESLDIVDGIFTSTKNQFVYDYVYDIAEIMLGSNWQNKLADREYEDEQDVIDTFYKESKMPIDKAFEKYSSQKIKEMWDRIPSY